MKVYEVIPHLYIRGGFPGSWTPAIVVDGLRQHGIKSVLALHPHGEPALANSLELEYRYTRMVDGPKLPPETEDCVDWVVRRVNKEWSTLVMCRGGRNRSGLVVALTVQDVIGCSGAEAIEILRRARPTALSNEVFAQYVLTKETA